MAHDGMLARYNYIVFLKSGYDDKIVCGEKRIGIQNDISVFLEAF